MSIERVTLNAIALGSCRIVNIKTDVESSRRWFVEDIVDPLVEVHNGQSVLPPGGSYGYRLNEKVVGKYTLRTEVFVWR